MVEHERNVGACRDEVERERQLAREHAEVEGEVAGGKLAEIGSKPRLLGERVGLDVKDAPQPHDPGVLEGVEPRGKRSALRPTHRDDASDETVGNGGKTVDERRLVVIARVGAFRVSMNTLATISHPAAAAR